MKRNYRPEIKHLKTYCDVCEKIFKSDNYWTIVLNDFGFVGAFTRPVEMYPAIILRYHPKCFPYNAPGFIIKNDREFSRATPEEKDTKINYRMPRGYSRYRYKVLGLGSAGLDQQIIPLSKCKSGDMDILSEEDKKYLRYLEDSLL